MIWRDGLLAEACRPHELLLEDYETVRTSWKHSLGPAVLDESTNGHCLQFHPSEYKPV